MNDEFIDEFFHELSDLLTEAEAALLKLEDGSISFEEGYNIVYRSFHSAKGGAGMLGLLDLQKFVHYLEDKLEICKQQGVISKGYYDPFLKGIDQILRYPENKKVDLELITEIFNNLEKSGNKDEFSNEHEEIKKKVVEEVKKEEENLVYLIDDDKDFIESVVVTLSDIDCIRFVTFTNPKEVLTALDQETPKVMFIDFNMPEMNGLELIYVIKKYNAEIPIILFSRNLDVASLLKGIEYGVYTTLVKPFEKDLLISTAINALRHYDTNRLLERSLNLLTYQFSGLSKFLEENNKHEIKKILTEEIKVIKNQREILRKIVKEELQRKVEDLEELENNSHSDL